MVWWWSAWERHYSTVPGQGCSAPGPFRQRPQRGFCASCPITRRTITPGCPRLLVWQGEEWGWKTHPQTGHHERARKREWGMGEWGMEGSEPKGVR